MQKAVIFDIDGTLANNIGRQYILENDPHDWEAFFGQMENDIPEEPVVELYNIIRDSNRYKMLLVSGRPENYRETTEQWLRRNNIHYDELLMRKKDDRRPDTTIKQEILDRLEKEYCIAFAVDDRKAVVDMWRNNGIFCFQCRDNAS